VQPAGGSAAQVHQLGPKVGSRLALFCIHCVNRVNSRNDSDVTESWRQHHKHCPGIINIIFIPLYNPEKVQNYYCYYYYYYYYY